MQTALGSAPHEHSMCVVMLAGLNPEREMGVLGMQTWKRKAREMFTAIRALLKVDFAFVAGLINMILLSSAQAVACGPEM